MFCPATIKSWGWCHRTFLGHSRPQDGKGELPAPLNKLELCSSWVLFCPAIIISWAWCHCTRLYIASQTLRWQRWVSRLVGNSHCKAALTSKVLVLLATSTAKLRRLAHATNPDPVTITALVFVLFEKQHWLCALSWHSDLFIWLDCP